MFRRIAIVLILAVASSAAFGAGSASEKSVRELLGIMGTGEMGAQMLRNMLPSLRTMAPEVPQEFWTEVERDIKPQEFVDLLVPIYRSHLSETDVLALIKFFRTPSGSRFISKQPDIMKESMQAGQRWGEAVGQRVLERLRLAQPADEAQPGVEEQTEEAPAAESTPEQAEPAK